MYGGTPSYHYVTYTSSAPAPTKGFSWLEIQHILIAVGVLTFDFTLLLSGIAGANMFLTRPSSASVATALLFALPTAAMAVLTGFFGHEMAHKFSAQRMKLWAEFRMSVRGLALSVVFSFLGFLWALPGATVVRGAGTKRVVGLTCLAGPASNFLWAGVFGALSLIPFRYYGHGYLAPAFFYVSFINIWFAIFNLLPFWVLDGKKILAWNKWVWMGTFFPSVALFISFYIFQII